MLFITNELEASYLVVIALAMTGLSCVLHASELLHYHSYPTVTFSNVE